MLCAPRPKLISRCIASIAQPEGKPFCSSCIHSGVTSIGHQQPPKAANNIVASIPRPATCPWVLAKIDAPVAIVTDPPYDEPDALVPFFAQVAAHPVSALLMAYRNGVDLLPLLERDFDTSQLPGTRGRSLYWCLPRS
jgi:hypothetical protein